ncbi:MAG: VOC family protein [Armatimonadota bacterium]
MPDYRLEHAAISVSDLDRAIDWYGKAFGFREVAKSDKPALKVRVALLRLGESMLEVFQPYKPEPMPEAESALDSSLQRLGTKHMAIAVRDIAAAYDHLKAQGVDFDTDIVEGSTSRFFFCRDPDGILIEVIQRN